MALGYSECYEDYNKIDQSVFHYDVKVASDKTDIDELGKDRCEFMISTNIIGDKLHKESPLKYNLKEAFFDWFQDFEQKSLY